jgi:hypothetical protein
MSATAWTLDDFLQVYLAKRAYPIPVPHRKKKPTLEAWPELRVTAETVGEYFNGDGPSNVGLLLGPSALIDVDLDCSEAVELARTFLPETPCKFGRATTGISHWVYRAAETPTVKFEDADGADGKRMLVELRSRGAQTLVPPSVHPSGEPVTFVAGAEVFEPAAVEGATLLRRVRLLAVSALLARHWPGEGLRHQVALAAAGLLAKFELPLEDAMAVIVSAARVGGDEEAKERRRDVLSTYDRLAAGVPLVGGPNLAEHLRDGLAVVKRLRSWFRLTAEPLPTDRLSIDAGHRDLAVQATKAWEALLAANVPPVLFAHGRHASRIEAGERPQIHVVDLDRMRARLARVAYWYVDHVTQAGSWREPAYPPEVVARDLLVTAPLPLPTLERIVTYPVFAPDGRVIDQPGYDAETGIVYAPPVDLQLEPVPKLPTAVDVQAAVALLTEWIGEFPFVTAADQVHILAVLLARFLRAAIRGPEPLVLIEKPSPGTGATLLIDVLALCITGRPVDAFTEAKDEDEWRKKITTALLTGPDLIVIDNLRAPLTSGHLASALTRESWQDRLLTTNQMVSPPIRCGWVATANNPILSDEMMRRAVTCRLDAKVDRPWERTGFRHADLRSWTLTHRGALIRACLVLGRAWFVAGQPPGTETLGMYEGWCRVIGGVLGVAGLPGFLANRATFYDRVDLAGEAIRRFLAAWWATYGPAPQTVATLLTLPPAEELDIESKSDRGRASRLGRLFARLSDRVFILAGVPPVMIAKATDTPQWQLVPPTKGNPPSGAGFDPSGAGDPGTSGTWRTSTPPAPTGVRARAHVEPPATGVEKSSKSPMSPSIEDELFGEETPPQPPHAATGPPQEHPDSCDCSECIPDW